MHTITGGNDAEQRRDGDYLGKDERYARTDEYLRILRRAWPSEAPFDHEGRFYRVRGLRHARPGRTSSRDPALLRRLVGRRRTGRRRAHADVYRALGRAAGGDRRADRQGARRRGGRRRDEPPRISVSFRPILGATDEEAWERAHRILDGRGGEPRRGPGHRQALRPRQRRRRRTSARSGCSRPPSAASGTTGRCGRRSPRPVGAYGNTTALVGSPETVAQALLDYVDIGVTTLLIRGFDPLEDAVDYGRHLLPLVRQEVARRDSVAVA